MSYQAMSWAASVRGLKRPGDKLLLLMLAYHLNDQSGLCCPSIPLLMSETGMSRDFLRDSIRRLAADGYISAERRSGSCTSYKLAHDRAAKTAGELSVPGSDDYRVAKTTGEQGLPGPGSDDYRDRVVTTTPNKESNRESNRKDNKEEKRPFVPDEVASGEISRSLYDDWMQIRKAKRAPLTATAWAGIVREAGKAGMTLPEALEMMIERGWQGFKASWRDVQERKAPPPAPACGQQAELTLTAPERRAWDAYIDLVQQGYDRVKWARWAIENFPGGALEQRARSILYKAGAQA